MFATYPSKHIVHFLLCDTVVGQINKANLPERFEDGICYCLFARSVEKGGEVNDVDAAASFAQLHVLHGSVRVVRCRHTLICGDWQLEQARLYTPDLVDSKFYWNL